MLGPSDAGRFSIVIGVVQFLSLLIELTADEALVKFGFRYATQGDWGRFHRVVRATFAFEAATSIAAGFLIAGFAPFAGTVFGDAHGLDGRADRRGADPVAAVDRVDGVGAADSARAVRHPRPLPRLWMALRLVGLVLGAPHGVTAAVLGLLVAQVITTASIAGVGLLALRRFPKAAPRRARGGPAAVHPLRALELARHRARLVPHVDRAARARASSAPPPTSACSAARRRRSTRFAVLSAPVRMVLLTEQTRDWEARPARR